MATREGRYVDAHLYPPPIEWAGLLASDSGQWRLLAHFRHKCIHVYGTFDGATLTFEGTNENEALATPSHAVTLKDEFQQDLVFTSPGIRVVHENPFYLRPLVTGGGASTDITVVLVCRD